MMESVAMWLVTEHESGDEQEEEQHSLLLIRETCTAREREREAYSVGSLIPREGPRCDG